MAELRHSGERLPGGDPRFRADRARHLAPYFAVLHLVRDRTVLDAGCGEGYGSALLAEVAREVVGVDYSAAVVAEDAARYPRPNLRFVCCDVEALATLGRSFEWICSFQVIEHLPEPGRFLAAAGAALAPDGSIVLTTPNRLRCLTENPYHLREYTAAELRDLLGRHFDGVTVRGIDGNERVRAYEAARAEQVASILRWDPLGLRRLLPQSLSRWAFGRLASVVRERIAARDTTLPTVGPEDFAATEDADGALDLFAICHRPRAG